jgi:hypothetical protein
MSPALPVRIAAIQNAIVYSFPRLQVQRPHPVLLGTRDGTARRLNPGDALAVRRPDSELAGHARPQYGRCGAAVFPCYVHFYAAAGSQSAKVAIRPRRRQSRKQCDHPGVTLQQHLGNS